MLKSLVLWISLPLFLCSALFHFKHEVQVLEDAIQCIKYDIIETQECIEVLDAEWGHLTDPQRLTQLNAQFLKLTPTEPKQLVTLSDIPEKSIINQKDNDAAFAQNTSSNMAQKLQSKTTNVTLKS
ncbi:MAG: hypothetical protein Q8L85_08355 [Alphaproteobacteria bacterium]|nr:hypothetical protein [Alphaproteobacteria bacterium]MDP3532233.1 hypothetical protein [Alphaproteobacteria bacterium]